MSRMILDEFVTIFRFQVLGAETVGKKVNAMQAQIAAANRSMGRMTMMMGAGFLFASKGIGNLENRIIGLGVQANVADEDVWALYKTAQKLGNESGITGSSMLEGIEEIVDKTGKLKFAEENLTNMANLIRGGKMDAKDAGGLLSVFADFEEFGATAADITVSLDMLTAASKRGSLPLKEQGALLPRVLAAYSATGDRDIVRIVKESQAAMQLINTVTRSGSKTSTAFENMILDYSKNIDKVNKLTGENFSGNEGINVIMEAIITSLSSGDVGFEQISGTIMDVGESANKTKNNLASMNGMFGRRALRGVAGYGVRLNRINEAYENMSNSTGELEKDTGRFSGSLNNMFAQLNVELEKLQVMLFESGAIATGMDMIKDAIAALVGIISIIPDWVMKAIVWFMILRYVLVGPVFFALSKVTMGIIAMAGATTTGAVGVARLGTAFTALAAKMGLVGTLMAANPLLSGLLLGTLAVLGIGGGIMMYKRHREKTAALNRPAPTITSSGTNQTTNNATTVVNVDATGAADPQGVEVAVDRAMEKIQLADYAITQKRFAEVGI